MREFKKRGSTIALIPEAHCAGLLREGFKKEKKKISGNKFCMIWVLWHLSDGLSRELERFDTPVGPRSKLRRVPHPKIEKNKCVLK